jgi:hypothetical protein
MMENIDKEALKKNRRTALKVAAIAVAFQLIGFYVILKTITEEANQLLAIGIGTLAFLLVFSAIVVYKRRLARK